MEANLSWKGLGKKLRSGNAASLLKSGIAASLLKRENAKFWFYGFGGFFGFFSFWRRNFIYLGMWGFFMS